MLADMRCDIMMAVDGGDEDNDLVVKMMAE